MCALGQVLRLSIACLYGVVGGGWALSAPLAQKGNSYHYHFFLLDSINDRLGRLSILRDWRTGDLRRTGVLLVAGYTCGFFWEFWNYWAYTKWVYTVPVPEMLHIFEMPILGFLGFGPFALETFAFWTLVWGRK